MNLGKRKGYRVEGQKVILTFEQGEAWIRAVTPEIINVFCGLEGKEQRSQAIEGNKEIPAELSVESGEDGLWIRTGAVSVRVSDGFYVDFFDSKGAEVCMDYRGGERVPADIEPGCAGAAGR